MYDKRYMPNMIKKHFTLSQAVAPKKITKRRVYKFVDYNKESVQGSWYSKEIQKFTDNQYRIKNV